MASNPIAIKMIRSTIDKTIRDIKDNPQRGLKNLANLANRYANHTFQKDLIKNLKPMLVSSNNPYYNIIPSLVNHVNHYTIKTFIINMAYNSFSYGGGKIKQYKKFYNYTIPWTIVFNFTKASNKTLNNKMIFSIIEQGKKIGIYTYMFFTDDINHFSDILRQHLDCAFILYVPPIVLTKENIVEIKSFHNTFFTVLYQPSMDIQAFENATKLLYDNQCLFGSYSYYSNENIEHILSNRWVDEIVTTKSPFGFLIESQNCSQANASLIHDYIDNSKANPKYPTFIIDLYEDITKVDNQLSKYPCIFKIMGNEDIDNMTLIEILSISNSIIK